MCSGFVDSQAFGHEVLGRPEEIRVQRGALDRVEVQDEVYRAVRRLGPGALRFEELAASLTPAALLNQ